LAWDSFGPKIYLAFVLFYFNKSKKAFSFLKWTKKYYFILISKLRKEWRVYIKPYEKHKIEFNPNNFEFLQNMQGDRCMIRHKNKITNNF
jgi:hypothetical protein